MSGKVIVSMINHTPKFSLRLISIEDGEAFKIAPESLQAVGESSQENVYIKLCLRSHSYSCVKLTNGHPVEHVLLDGDTFVQRVAVKLVVSYEYD